MIVYLNGRFLPEENATISIHDRGFLYGDGLFEGVRFHDGKPFLWPDHAARFEHGCAVLGLRSPLSLNETRCVMEETARRNSLQDGLIRITLSRGAGMRGYSPKGAEHPTLAMTPHLLPALPTGYRAILSTVRLPVEDPLSDFKNINKLHQIMARSEADAAHANEALLTNTEGFVVEGTTTNLFWIKNDVVCTPPVRGILAGTSRLQALRVCARLGLRAREKNIRPAALGKVDGIFLTSCAVDIMEVTHLDGVKLKRSPLVRKLKAAYLK